MDIRDIPLDDIKLLFKYNNIKYSDNDDLYKKTLKLIKLYTNRKYQMVISTISIVEWMLAKRIKKRKHKKIPSYTIDELKNLSRPDILELITLLKMNHFYSIDIIINVMKYLHKIEDEFHIYNYIDLYADKNFEELIHIAPYQVLLELFPKEIRLLDNEIIRDNVIV